VQALPEMRQRIATEGKPGEDVAHAWGQGKSVAGEAGDDEKGIDARNRSEDR